jgi:hypothetical protein
VHADVRPVAWGALDLERTTQGIDSLSYLVGLGVARRVHKQLSADTQ